MQTCRSCSRHLIHAESTCPFCGAAQPSALEKALVKVGGTMLAVLTPMVLAACYGPPTKESGSTAPDVDGDGYDALVDCNDNDANVNPGAKESCSDQVDNDCDGKIDGDDSDCATP